MWMTFVGHCPPFGSFDLSSSSSDVLRNRAILVGDRGASVNFREIFEGPLYNDRPGFKKIYLR
jgi:hypothetical protein